MFTFLLSLRFGGVHTPGLITRLTHCGLGVSDPALGSLPHTLDQGPLLWLTRQNNDCFSWGELTEVTVWLSYLVPLSGNHCDLLTADEDGEKRMDTPISGAGPYSDPPERASAATLGLYCEATVLYTKWPTFIVKQLCLLVQHLQASLFSVTSLGCCLRQLFARRSRVLSLTSSMTWGKHLEKIFGETARTQDVGNICSSSQSMIRMTTKQKS